MTHAESEDHPLLLFYNRIRVGIRKLNQTSVQQAEFVKQNDDFFNTVLLNKNFRVTGRIHDISSDSLSLEILLPYPLRDESLGSNSIYGEYKYDPLFNETLITLSRGQLVTCEGKLLKFTYDKYTFRLTGYIFILSKIVNFNGKSDEEIRAQVKSQRKTKWYMWGIISLLITIFFISVGGWAWVLAIIAGFFSYYSFSEGESIN